MEEFISSGPKMSLSNVHTLTNSNGLKNHDENGTNKSKHEVTFSTYAYSRLGTGCKANNDNFYCNGSYMKHFKYEDFKKSDTTENDIGIFAVCCDETDNDEGCKLVFKCLSEIQDKIYKSGSIYRIKQWLIWYINEAHKRLIQDAYENGKQYRVSMSIAVLYKNTAVYASCGNSAIIFYEENQKMSILHRMPDNFIGVGGLNIKVNIKPYNTNSKFAFCTKGITTKLSIQDMEVAGSHETEKDVAVNLVDIALEKKTDNNSTCLVVRNCKNAGIKLMSLLIMACCGFVVCLDVIILMKLFA